MAKRTIAAKKTTAKKTTPAPKGKPSVKAKPAPKAKAPVAAVKAKGKAKAPVAKPAAATKAAKPAIRAGVARAAKPAKRPSAIESDGLKIVRGVFDAFGWDYKVTAGDDDETAEIFVATAGAEVFSGVKAIHYPGRLILFGAAPFSLPESCLDEAYKYVSLVNNALQDGCLMVRTPSPAEVTFRTAVNYTRIENLQPGLVAGAISDLLEGAEATFSGLVLVAKGAPADTAFDAL